MPQQFFDPAGAYIQGQDSRLRADAMQTRNAMAGMELANAPQEMANRNKLLDTQVQSAQQGLSADKAKFAYAQLKQALDSGNPKAFVLQNIPPLAAKLRESNIDLSSMDDQAATQMIDMLARKYAGEAGIVPQPKVETIGDPNNPAAGVLQRDPVTGKLNQVTAAQRPETASFSPVPMSDGTVGRFNNRSGQLESTGQKGGTRAGIPQMTDEQMQSRAKMISNYEMPPPSSYEMARNPSAAALMESVAALNPGYSANEYGARSKAFKDFATGKQGVQVKSFNVAINHLDSLEKAADALDNGDTPLFNRIGNAISRETGKAPPSNFEGMKKVVTDEIVKAIVGAGGGVADREEAAKTLSSASSPAQLIGMMNKYRELMAGQLSGLQQQYEQSTGRQDFDRWLSPSAKQYLSGHSQTALPDAASSAITATGPNGQRIQLVNGQWVPLGK